MKDITSKRTSNERIIDFILNIYFIFQGLQEASRTNIFYFRFYLDPSVLMEFFELDALAPTQYIHADGDVAILELATLDKELKFVIVGTV